MAKKKNADQNTETKQPVKTEDVLDQLAFLANEEIDARDKLFLQQNQKRKKRAKKDANAENDQQNVKAEKAPEREDSAPQEGSGRGKNKPGKKAAVIPGIEDPAGEGSSAAADNTFTAFAEQMLEAGKVLREEEHKDAKEEEAARPEPQKKKRKNKNRSKELRETGHVVGEEITKEKAENIISGGNEGNRSRGHRATIIVRRMVVDTEGNRLDDIPEETAPPEAKVPEPAAEPEPEEKRLLLISDATGEAFLLDHDLSIGREDDNDLCIPEPDGHYVSGHHAIIVIQGRDVFLKDTDSTNGTFINGKRIGSKRLKPGQKVKFADVEFSVTEG